MNARREAMLAVARSAIAVGAKLLQGPGSARRLREQGMARYRARIATAVRGYLSRVMRRPVHDPSGIGVDLAWLEAEMIALGEMFLPEAFGMGLGPLPLGEEEDEIMGGLIFSNTVFVRRSLVPSFAGRIEAIRQAAVSAGEREFGRRVLDSLAWFQARAELYAGGYWSAFWAGLQRAIRRLYPDQAGPAVRRLLEPTAQHCATCPPKAREYSSWDVMLAQAGGLPGDGSDECRSHCRCRLQVQVEGVWLEALAV